MRCLSLLTDYIYVSERSSLTAQNPAFFSLLLFASDIEQITDECIYDDAEIARVKYVYAHGHQVASHTWSHPVCVQCILVKLAVFLRIMRDLSLGLDDAHL